MIRTSNLKSLKTHLLRGMANQVRSTAASGSQVYESKRAVDEYLLFHYGQPSDLMPHSLPLDFAQNFSERSHDLVVRIAEQHRVATTRVLDVGCAVGGLSFELAKTFPSVVGVDFSQHFVDAANHMKSDGSHDYDIMVQGELFERRTATVSRDVDRSRVSFYQGDACHLSSSLGLRILSLLVSISLQFLYHRSIRCYRCFKSAMPPSRTR